MGIWEACLELVLRYFGVQIWLWVPLACVFARQCYLLLNTRDKLLERFRHPSFALPVFARAR